MVCLPWQWTVLNIRFELIHYRPQKKFAKVMFLQVSVCPQGEGVCMVAGECAWLGSAWLGGHAWLPVEGVCGWWGGIGCLVGCAWLLGGHVWLPGEMHGCQGACIVVVGLHSCQGECMVARGVHGCGGCRGIMLIHRSPSRPRPSMRLTATFINIHEHLI